MFNYAFMQRAFVVGIMLAIIIPMIGIIMINRRTTMIGDALSHASLSGIGFGLILGVNPIWTSLIVCIIASFAIEIIRSRFKDFGDMAVALVMSAGIAIAAILSDFTPGGTSFESFMFGSITTVSKVDVYTVLIIFVAIVLISIYFYNALLYNTINPTMARLAGVNTKLVNIIFTFITAITVAISAKTVGALMITSLMTIPVATALLVSNSYKITFIKSIVFSIIYMVLGIIASFYLGVKPGGAIVLIAIGFLIMVILISNFKNYISRNIK